MQTSRPLFPVQAFLGFASLKIISTIKYAMIVITLLLVTGNSLLHAQTKVEQMNLTTAEKIALKDTVKVRITQLPALKPQIADSIITPSYQFLWIFGDGGFVNGTPDSVMTYRYLPSNVIQNTSATTYSTGLYSTKGKRPPRLEGPVNVSPATNIANYEAILTVDPDSGALNLQSNHLGVVPNDTSVWILSLQNTSKSIPWSGQLYLFYESIIEEEFVSPPLTTGEREIGFGMVSNQPSNAVARFRHDTTLVYFDNMDKTTYTIDSIKSGQLTSRYKKALVWDIDTIIPGEEKRVFVQFRNDPQIYDKFSPDAKGKVRFMGMFVAEVPPGGPTGDFPTLDNEDQLLIELNGLQGFINNLGAYNENDTILQTNNSKQPFYQLYQAFFDPETQTSALGNRIVDVFEGEIYAAKGHDPNKIEVVTCECPPNTDGAQKLITTIDFVNTGTAPTDTIFIEMPIPPGIDINSISATPLKTDPAIPSTLNVADYVNLIVDETNRKILWRLDDFILGSTAERGVGHPDTEGQIVFSMLTEPGYDINDLPKFHACIRFFETDKAVCTIPVEVSPILNDPLSGEQNYLVCEECKKETGTFECLPGMPWWVCLIILLVLVLVGYVVYRELQS